MVAQAADRSHGAAEVPWDASDIRPPESSSTRSAAAIVSGLWAMTIRVTEMDRIASLICFSRATSRWEVASSRSRIFWPATVSEVVVVGTSKGPSTDVAFQIGFGFLAR